MEKRRAAQDDSRRSGARILDTAEGVLITLHRCSLDQAFSTLVHTAKRHNLGPLSLADALVALAQGQPTEDLDADAVRIAVETWGALLDGHRNNGMHWTPTTTSQGDPGLSTRAEHSGQPARLGGE